VLEELMIPGDVRVCQSLSGTRNLADEGTYATTKTTMY
jgi:hypothetical protein